MWFVALLVLQNLPSPHFDFINEFFFFFFNSGKIWIRKIRETFIIKLVWPMLRNCHNLGRDSLGVARRPLPIRYAGKGLGIYVGFSGVFFFIVRKGWGSLRLSCRKPQLRTGISPGSGMFASKCTGENWNLPLYLLAYIPISNSTHCTHTPMCPLQFLCR